MSKVLEEFPKDLIKKNAKKLEAKLIEPAKGKIFAIQTKKGDKIPLISRKGGYFFEDDLYAACKKMSEKSINKTPEEYYKTLTKKDDLRYKRVANYFIIILSSALLIIGILRFQTLNSITGNIIGTDLLSYNIGILLITLTLIGIMAYKIFYAKK